ncbi:gamma-glutamyl-gamma-aminobutyrate hydrolase family protein [Microbacterium sp.]|uniref:gamma-glutamyl-gamma-aminobutyrate hydrolase family protein n=1 Tax=Microbacterium sp. TaxID=51671 RepID=UPI0025D01205|nr:gamma-glutamyl-gamma-aminobutyrate hydrolase family protein [Microbacterium sp.]
MTRLPRIAMPARLSDAEGADARVGLANAIFDDVAALVRAEELDVVVVRDADLAGFDGVVLPGGGDIDPARYGGDTAASVYDVNPAQDDLDLAVVAAAVTAGLPILGVCRGLQVLNVAFGGTLIEDIAAGEGVAAVRHTPGDDGCGALEWTWHPVTIASPSRLHAEVDADEIAVASGHHQAIRALGEGLRATAVAADGIVEAVEHVELPIIAVQWHPEAEGTPAHLAGAPFAVFADLVRARPVRR